MTDAMSKALDELMGKHRNVADNEAQKIKMKFDDEEVCKHELAGLCPYTLFNNTKSDLGARPTLLPCSFLAPATANCDLATSHCCDSGSCGFEVHGGHREFERLKKEYDALSEDEKEERGYERVLHDLLVQLVHKMDRTISKNKEMVEKDNQPRSIKPVDQARLDALKQQEQGTLSPPAFHAAPNA
jgi:RNA-binding protein Luc7-like 2